MKTYEQYLQSLEEHSVWMFTKQETDFDSAYLSATLFDEIPSRESTNIESYFKNNHYRYGIETDRHRTLVIPQLYGLITKTPFYTRGGSYNNEKPTAVFDEFKNARIKYSNYSDFIKSYEYNTLKTEQILKIKIHAIIDTANNNIGYNVFPVIFIYQVLRKLKEKYNIKTVSLDHLYTYVLTCQKYSDVDDAVEYIYNKCPITDYVKRYKDLSRVLTFIKKNINLFEIDSENISINNKYDDYFYNNFMSRYNFEELHDQLNRDVDYSYYLYNLQNFNINLIDDPLEETKHEADTDNVSTYVIDDDEVDYETKIEEIKERNVNEEVSRGAHSIEPIVSRQGENGRRYRVNPLLGKIAIQKAYYSCEFNPRHNTFVSDRTNKNYMEAHHFVPVKYIQEIWRKHRINVDCVENIVSLCPNCHMAFHHGSKEVRKKMIESVYEKILPRYKSIGFNIEKEELFKYYNL